MPQPIRDVVVLGGGSAGCLSAVALKTKLPHLNVTLVRSTKVPVIGVGESTTRAVPLFLHRVLGIPIGPFHQAVRPVWKLGLRLEWGRPDRSHFNYPFDDFLEGKVRQLSKATAFYCLDDAADASRFSAMMDRGISPVSRTADGGLRCDDSCAYHLDNTRLLRFLEQHAAALGVTLVEGDLLDVERDDQGPELRALRLEDGRRVTGDFFVDCSGFASLLLGRAMNQPYVDYRASLPCDRAVIGSWSRTGAVRLYTTAETMDHGWCWRIDFRERVTRGYVYCSTFCDDDEAENELRRANPEIGDDLKLIRFPSGRHQNFWVHNVAAVGNSSGFVEPLEATSLQMIVEQLRVLCRALEDTDGLPPPAMLRVENQRFRDRWDDVRDFLALHFRFNGKRNTPFWRHCRADVRLEGAEPLVEYYQEVGPSTLCNPLITPESIFGYAGYIALLLGQGVPTCCRFRPSPEETRIWREYRRQVVQSTASRLRADEALALV